MKINPSKYGLNDGLLPCEVANGQVSVDLPIKSLKNTISLIQYRNSYTEQNISIICGGSFIGYVISLIIAAAFFKVSNAMLLAFMGIVIGGLVTQQKRSNAQDSIDYEIAQSISLSDDDENLVKARSKLISINWSNFCKFFDEVQNQIDGLEEIGEKWWLSKSSYALEKAVAEMFSRRGFNSRVTPGSGDGGIDVTVEKFENRNLYIQCKGWKDKVGPQIVRELVGSLNVIQDSKAQGIVYCSKGYTQGAIDYANQSKVVLWMPEDLAKIAERYPIVNSN